MDTIQNVFKSAREYWTPVLTESMFLDRGMLTPDEFVRAGDQLIRTCPNWRWESGESSKLRPYLPPDKQFLSISGVPSYRRVIQMQSAAYTEDEIEGGDGAGETGESWCAPQMRAADNRRNDEDDFDVIEAGEIIDTAASLGDKSVGDEIIGAQQDEFASIESRIQAVSISDPQSEDDVYADMEEESLALDDAAASPSTSILGSNGDPMIGASSSHNAIVKSRRYDVSITYDNYYRTPRIWLFGYNENGSPLSTEQVFQDVMQDYARKTVTVDPHPHMSKPHASIHPCQHSAAMLNIIQALQDCGKSPEVEQYMFIFLKFIQSVVPTIEYDYTIDVQARAAK